MENPLEFYSTHSKFSDPGKYAYLYDGLPTAISDLCTIVHGLVIDFAFDKMFGVTLSDERKKETQTRYIEKALERILEMDKSALSKLRQPKDRIAGSCRDFALLLCSILRHQKVPARLRCGFETYFNTGKHEDHWIVEYWHADEERWILVDPEVGHVEREREKVTIDNLDISYKDYFMAGKAWKVCKDKEEDANNFGVSTINIFGLWFVRANVLRDLASLNKIELLPWEYWEFSDKQYKTVEEMPVDDKKLIDTIASLIFPGGNGQFAEFKQLYNAESRVQVPSTITSYTLFGPEKVEI